MTAFHPNRSGHDRDGELGLVRSLVSKLVTFIVLIVTLGFSITLLAAATGNLDTLRSLVGL